MESSNKIMRVFLFFVLRIVFIPFAYSQSSSGVSYTHICVYVGDLESAISGFKFSIADYPAACDVAFYSTYTLDAENTTVFPADEDAIKSLVAANKPVFIFLEYQAEVEPWGDIIDPKDPATADKIMCPLKQWITDTKVTGIILGISDIYDETLGPAFDCKISAFVTQLKVDIPNLQVALVVNAPYSYDKLKDQSLFDYTLTNSVIDMYIVNMFTHSYCTPEYIQQTGGGTILTSTDPTVASMDKLVDVVSQSTMDPDRIYARVQITAYLPYQSDYTVAPYGNYCQAANPTDICNSCIDNNTNLYNEGAFVKSSSFHGIAATWLDYDDYCGVCECQQFPAAKALFDGFDGTAMTPCPKLDVR